MDPNEREERVMDGLLVIAMNKHREICTIQSSGGIMLLKDQVSALINVLLRIGFFFLEVFSCFCFILLFLVLLTKKPSRIVIKDIFSDSRVC